MVGRQTRDLESIEPTTGCLINGLYLEGAAWCSDKHCLIEMENGRIHNEMATVREYFTLSSQVCSWCGDFKWDSMTASFEEKKKLVLSSFTWSRRSEQRQCHRTATLTDAPYIRRRCAVVWVIPMLALAISSPNWICIVIQRTRPNIGFCVVVRLYAIWIIDDPSHTHIHSRISADWQMIQFWLDTSSGNQDFAQFRGREKQFLFFFLNV